jgi:aminopeptidase N
MEMIILFNETAQQIKYASRTDTIPVLNERQVPCFLSKGAWALFALRR